MREIVTRCPAKLNLTFDILGALADGYHEVVTLMQAIDLEDVLTFRIEPADELSVTISLSSPEVPGFPLDSTNLIAKSAKAFSIYRGTKESWKILVSVEKRIPVAAGLAGGSANAAATLVALNSCVGVPLPPGELLDLACDLGADVPFCLAGGTKLGTRRGDRLSDACHFPDLSFLVVKPREIAISTAWAYQEYDSVARSSHIEDLQRRPDARSAAQVLGTGDLRAAARGFGNVFEPMVLRRHPVLALVKERLIELGAWNCCLTGSGPTLFAVSDNLAAAQFMQEQLYLDESNRSAPWSSNGAISLECRIARSTMFGARVIDNKD